MKKEDFDKDMLYIQEIGYIVFKSNWNKAHELQDELIKLIEKFYNERDIKIYRIGYGVREVKE